MADAVFIGGTSAAYATAANWDPVAVPATDVTLIFNGQSQQGMDGTDISASPKNHAMIVEESFIYAIGSAGQPFEPTGITSLYFAGAGTATSYINIGATGGTDMDNVVVDSPSAKSPILILGGTNGDIARLTVRRGKVEVANSTIIDGKVTVIGGIGASTSELTLGTGLTLAGLEVAIEGGKLTTSTLIPTLQMKGGEAVLSGSAGLTLLEQSDGTVFWDAISTIALAEIRGGRFATRTTRIGRVLTNCNMYGDAVVDFRLGGTTASFLTNPIRVHGTNEPMFPPGHTITVGL